MGIFNFVRGRQKVEHLWLDKEILHYLIVDCKLGAGTDRYIYPKPGMFNDEIAISNIDFVMEVYAKHGIFLKKTVSLDDKKTEVLYISGGDLGKLSQVQQEFLVDSAPLNALHVDAAKQRIIEIERTVSQTLGSRVMEKELNSGR